MSLDNKQTIETIIIKSLSLTYLISIPDHIQNWNWLFPSHSGSHQIPISEVFNIKHQISRRNFFQPIHKEICWKSIHKCYVVSSGYQSSCQFPKGNFVRLGTTHGYHEYVCGSAQVYRRQGYCNPYPMLKMHIWNDNKRLLIRNEKLLLLK